MCYDGRMDEPVFDPVKAAEMLGKTVLIGVTYEKADGSLIEQRQFFGTIRAVDETQIQVELEDGTPFGLPPDTRAFFEAPPGEYRLRSTGEVIEDPDYTTVWTSTAPPTSN